MPTRVNPDYALTAFDVSVAAKLTALDFGARATVADVVANAADQYLIGLTLPPGGALTEMQFRFRAFMSKTAAGVATPVWKIRVGTAGAIGDTARVTLSSGSAQTAAADVGYVEIAGVIRNADANAIIAAGLILGHNLAATGFASIGTPTVQANSGAFDITAPGLVIGLSVDPGAAGVWTHQLVMGELMGL